MTIPVLLGLLPVGRGSGVATVDLAAEALAEGSAEGSAETACGALSTALGVWLARAGLLEEAGSRSSSVSALSASAALRGLLCEEGPQK